MSPALRRARPLLGTLVEVGACGIAAAPAIEAAFAVLAQVQQQLSRFEPTSDIGRFNALPAGRRLAVHAHAQTVLRAARYLHDATDGLFDITLGSGSRGWALEGAWLVKQDPGVTLDLGGIGKGHAVDASLAALQDRGCSAGWVNAGGDLRVFGDLALTLQLRDETQGGTRAWGRLEDGACATSHFARGSRSALAGGGARHHLSVLAPCCLWADALTKVAALGRGHPVLRDLGATAVWH